MHKQRDQKAMFRSVWHSVLASLSAFSISVVVSVLNSSPYFYHILIIYIFLTCAPYLVVYFVSGSLFQRVCYDYDCRILQQQIIQQTNKQTKKNQESKADNSKAFTFGTIMLGSLHKLSFNHDNQMFQLFILTVSYSHRKNANV